MRYLWIIPILVLVGILINRLIVLGFFKLMKKTEPDLNDPSNQLSNDNKSVLFPKYYKNLAFLYNLIWIVLAIVLLVISYNLKLLHPLQNLVVKDKGVVLSQAFGFSYLALLFTLMSVLYSFFSFVAFIALKKFSSYLVYWNLINQKKVLERYDEEKLNKYKTLLNKTNLRKIAKKELTFWLKVSAVFIAVFILIWLFLANTYKVVNEKGVTQSKLFQINKTFYSWENIKFADLTAHSFRDSDTNKLKASFNLILTTDSDEKIDIWPNTDNTPYLNDDILTTTTQVFEFLELNNVVIIIEPLQPQDEYAILENNSIPDEYIELFQE